MVCSAAAIYDHPLIMLQHVQVVLFHEAIQHGQEPVVGRRVGKAEVRPGECGRFPVRGIIVREPIPAIRRENVEDNLPVCRVGIDSALRPAYPQAELETLRVGVIRRGSQPMRKLHRVRAPVTHPAKPSRVDMEHLQAKRRR